jgi:hypothetical protein
MSSLPCSQTGGSRLLSLICYFQRNKEPFLFFSVQWSSEGLMALFHVYLIKNFALVIELVRLFASFESHTILAIYSSKYIYKFCSIQPRFGDSIKSNFWKFVRWGTGFAPVYCKSISEQ